MTEDYEVIAEYEGMTIQEAKLTYAARQKLPATAFCGPNHSYPAHDAAHARNGLQRLSQFGSRLKPAVRARIHACLVARAKRFGVKVSETSNISPIVDWYLQEVGISNPKVVQLDPNEIEFSEAFQKNGKNDRLYERAGKFTKMHEKGETIPPITVFKRPDGKYEIHDGHARVVAFRKMGVKKIPAIVMKKGENPSSSSSSSPSSSSSSSKSSDSSSSSSKSSGSSLSKSSKSSGSSNSSSDSSHSSGSSS